MRLRRSGTTVMASKRIKSGEELAALIASSDRIVRPDDVPVIYAKSALGIELNLDIIPGNAESMPAMLIEGNRETLMFLANMLVALAKDPLDCGIEYSPHPKSNFFPLIASSDSTFTGCRVSSVGSSIVSSEKSKTLFVVARNGSLQLAATCLCHVSDCVRLPCTRSNGIQPYRRGHSATG